VKNVFPIKEKYFSQRKKFCQLNRKIFLKVENVSHFKRIIFTYEVNIKNKVKCLKVKKIFALIEKIFHNKEILSIIEKNISQSRMFLILRKYL
jgi:hypothetical protein